MTTGRINQVAALKTAPRRREAPNACRALPGERVLIWCGTAWRRSAITASRPARASTVPRRRARDPGVYAFTVAHSWVSPGLNSQRSERPGLQHLRVKNRLSADCPVARAASRRASRFCKRNAPSSRGHRPVFCVCYVCASRIRTSLPSSRTAGRNRRALWRSELLRCAGVDTPPLRRARRLA